MAKAFALEGAGVRWAVLMVNQAAALLNWLAKRITTMVARLP